MEKVAPLHSWSKPFHAIVISAVLITGCASTARSLPPDYSSVDARQRLHLEDFEPAVMDMTCLDIEKELKQLESANAVEEKDITDKRHDNQVAGYIGSAFFLPVLLATDNSEQAKKKIRDINKAKDNMYKLQSYKKCPSQLAHR